MNFPLNPSANKNRLLYFTQIQFTKLSTKTRDLHRIHTNPEIYKIPEDLAIFAFDYTF